MPVLLVQWEVHSFSPFIGAAKGYSAYQKTADHE